ncbi:hypothetical protein ACRAWF_21915 [Streptomyces sp. L7]
MDGLTFTGMRIRDTTADGINFHGGVTDSKVTNSDIRNTTVTTASPPGRTPPSAPTPTRRSPTTPCPCRSSPTPSRSTAVTTTPRQRQPRGGHRHRPGRRHPRGAARFTSTPVGTTTISDNTMVRAGGLDPNWQFGVGALWFDGGQGAITGPHQRDQRADPAEPLRSGPVGRGHHQRGQPQQRDHRRHRNLRPPGTDRRRGQVHQRLGHRRRLLEPGVQLLGRQLRRHRRRRPNSGISATPYCGGWPAPVYPPYPPEGVTATPGALNFGSVATGSTSDGARP